MKFLFRVDTFFTVLFLQVWTKFPPITTYGEKLLYETMIFLKLPAKITMTQSGILKHMLSAMT